MTIGTAPSGSAEPPHQEIADQLERRPWPALPLLPGVEVSFEFFPPATAAGLTSLETTAARLAALDPSFISVTYGAGGSTQDRTFGTLERLEATIQGRLTGHLTCIGASADHVDAVLDRYRALGIRRVVALRGDAPDDGSDESPAGGYADAAALVSAIRSRDDGAEWDIAVAGYPEVHPKAADAGADLDSLKRKIDAGADRVLTQFFFDNEAFLRFHSHVRAAGIDIPVVPGIMPIANFDKVSSFAERCGTVIPTWMPQLFDGVNNAPEVHRLMAATVAAEQCRHLTEYGIRQFHFYTMNSAALTEATCRMLGIVPAAAS